MAHRSHLIPGFVVVLSLLGSAILAGVVLTQGAISVPTGGGLG